MVEEHTKTWGEREGRCEEADRARGGQGRMHGPAGHSILGVYTGKAKNALPQSSADRWSLKPRRRTTSSGGGMGLRSGWRRDSKT